MRLKILLDMDCVLADFVGGAAALHGTTAADLERYWTPGEYAMENVLARVLGWPPESSLKRTDAPTLAGRFWKPINDTPGFWAALPKLPWADELVKVVRTAAGDDWWVVSSPSRCHGCIREKEDWLAEHYGLPAHRLVPTGQKFLLANPTALLIDDYDHHVDTFREHGGHAVLFPALHNRDHALRHRALDAACHKIVNAVSVIRSWERK